MKSVISIFVSFLAVMACCLIMQCNAVKASAAYDFTITATELSAPEGAYAQAGDYKIELSLTNNLGFASGGIGVYVDHSNFSAVLNQSGELVYEMPLCDGSYQLCEYDNTTGLLGIGFVNSKNTQGNGVLFTCYVRRISNNTDAFPIIGMFVDQLCDADKNILTVTEPTSCTTSYIESEYIIGDVNGDGEITQIDAQIVETVVDANGGYISAADFEDDVPFYEYEGVICIGVVDVDGDSDIDDDDTEEILSCYVITDVMNNTYTGVVGTTGYYYTTVTVPISR